MKFIVKIVLVFIFISTVNSFGQRSKTGDNLSDSEKELMAENALQEGNYDKAVLLYKKLLDKKPDDSMLNFLVGFCYLNTDYGKKDAISYFEKAILNMKNTDVHSAPLETYYYLALAYYDSNKFNKAMGVLDEVTPKIPKNEDRYALKVKSLKQKCINGNKVSQNKLKIKVDNLFEINSKHSDYNPLINESETEIIFTSRRAGTKMSVKNTDNQYDANIYTSFNIDSVWQIPYSINSIVNSASHETATFISADQKTMIVQKYDRSKGSLYITKRKKTGEWGKLVDMGSNVNTRYRETAGSLSPNGRKLYFTSDRKDGFGGLDIYVSLKMKNGSWGVAKNLGSTINSAMDEETPFQHHNGTLFFCSKGHGSMGGFDIFASSEIDKDIWSKPVNLGIPINSVEDDFCYIPSLNGKFAYFASKRQGGKGNSDIYKVELYQQSQNYAIASGKITLPNKSNNVEIQITDIEGNNKKFFKPQYADNNFDIILITGKSYMLDIVVEDITVKKIKLNLGNIGSFISMEQHVVFNDINIESLKNISEENVQVEEYTSKPKSKNISDDNLLADNSTFGNTEKNSDDGKLFSIQLVVSKTLFDDEYFEGIQDLKKYRKKDKSYIYYFGEYIYEWEAMIKLRMIKDKYPQAKVFVNTFDKKEFN